MGWMDLLNQVAGGAGAERHFDQLAEHAPRDVLGQSVADAFRSDKTPPYEQMVGQLFGRSDPSQQAGLLNQLIAAVGPALMSGAAGGVLSKVLSPGATQVTPEQASKLDPSQVEQIVAHARADRARHRRPSGPVLRTALDADQDARRRGARHCACKDEGPRAGLIAT